MTGEATPERAAEPEAVRRDRARSQLLHRPVGHGPTQIVAALLAVAAQEPRSAPLAIRARGHGLLDTGIDHLLAERELVVGWLNRGTLHMVCTGDYAWLLALTAPARRAQSLRRLAEEGVSPADAQRGVETIERALTDGPLTRGELADRVEAAGVRAAGQAIVHMIMLTALDGVTIPAATTTDHHTLALTGDWLGRRPTVELKGESRDVALGELARRYLRGHGPASDRDLGRWAGVGLRDARRGLGRIAAELVEVGGDLVALRDRARRDEPLPAVLLPAFDPYMLGWADRGLAVATEHARRVHPGGGILRAVACADGRVVATWTARRRTHTIAVVVEPFTELDGDIARALAIDAADVARFHGLDAL
jgi:winged helix DNA-binding protein